MQRLIDNPTARQIFLDRHALAEPPTGPSTRADLLALINRLGFVQVDSINTVARAHDMILWSRRRSYRPQVMRRMVDRDRSLFEHWTHDAAVIPTEFLPHWRWRIDRHAPSLRARYLAWHGPEFEARLDQVIAHIREHGPAGSTDVGPDEQRSSGGWWDWNPSKAALEFLWQTGQLAVTRRDGFAKLYDLTHRVLPPCDTMTDARAMDWATNAALDRLGFATHSELAAFWGRIKPDEAAAWVKAALARGELEPIQIASADGTTRRSLARPGLEPRADAATRGIRILSPFDPALRDRKRTERLFGFHYRIEVFVPEAKRKFGYYVFPILEDDRLIGRVDARAKRAEGTLVVSALWLEPGIRPAKHRLARIEAQLARLARFAQCDRVDYETGWQRWND
ncbi:winged helix-turn-helix domain-containing protein [Paracoccus tegillarcae]|nr:crosslink repair DNA glycosylase YcaQ family protein [Paracoccus tegillarcae]